MLLLQGLSSKVGVGLKPTSNLWQDPWELRVGRTEGHWREQWPESCFGLSSQKKQRNTSFTGH